MKGGSVQFFSKIAKSFNKFLNFAIINESQPTSEHPKMPSRKCSVQFNLKSQKTFCQSFTRVAKMILKCDKNIQNHFIYSEITNICFKNHSKIAFSSKEPYIL